MTTNTPAPSPEPAPAPGAKKCPNCDTALAGGTYCPGCGAEVKGGRARDVGLADRVSALESEREEIAPLARLAKRLKGAGLDPDEIDDATLARAVGLRKMLGGGMMAQVARGMGTFFPGLPFGGGGDEEPPAEPPADPPPTPAPAPAPRPTRGGRRG